MTGLLGHSRDIEALGSLHDAVFLIGSSLEALPALQDVRGIGTPVVVVPAPRGDGLSFGVDRQPAESQLVHLEALPALRWAALCVYGAPRVQVTAVARLLEAGCGKAPRVLDAPSFDDAGAVRQIVAERLEVLDAAARGRAEELVALSRRHAQLQREHLELLRTASNNSTLLTELQAQLNDEARSLRERGEAAQAHELAAHARLTDLEATRAWAAVTAWWRLKERLSSMAARRAPVRAVTRVAARAVTKAASGTRVLVAGWFSFAEGGATAGDVLARDVVVSWLAAEGIAHDVAASPAMGGNVDWRDAQPDRYSHLVFVCGPVGPQMAAVPDLLQRYANCTRVAVNVSNLEPAWDAFDVVIARDGPGHTPRPDLSLLAARGNAPVVGCFRIHRQEEYADPRPDLAHKGFDAVLADRPASVLEIDTRLHPDVPGRRDATELDALVARLDVALTTRLHGLVLSLRHGVPVVAVDPIAGGAKVSAQAQALRWPYLPVEEATPEAIAALFEWALTDEAKHRAHAAAKSGTLAALRAREPTLAAIRGPAR